MTGLIVPPADMDLYRHYELIRSLRGLSLHSVIIESGFGYLGFNVYAWILNGFGLPAWFFPASVVFLGYELVIAIYSLLRRTYLRDSSWSTRFLVFITLWLSVDLVSLSSGIRSSLAILIVAYFGLRFLMHGGVILFTVTSVAAILVHPIAVVAIAATVIGRRFRRFSRYTKLFLWAGALGGLMGHLVVSGAMTLLSGVIPVSAIEAYFSPDGQWGPAFFSASSLNAILGGFVFFRLPGYLGFCYLVIKRPDRISALYVLLTSVALLLGSTFMLFTVYGRIQSYFILMFSIYIAIEYRKRRSALIRSFFVFYLLSLLLYAAAETYAYREFLFSML